MKHLRKYIKNMLLQEALHFNTPEELALFIYWDGSNTSYIFFRFDKAMNYIKKTLEGGKYIRVKELAHGLVYDGMQDQVVGGIRCGKPYKGSHWNASEVKLSAAESGWGPTLYDVVMGEQKNGIMADRKEVSQEAYRIWDYYLQHRDDIVKKPLDSEEYKWTERTDDDGQPGSRGRYNMHSKPENQEQFIEDATCWVFDRDPVPQAAAWKKNGKTLEDLLGARFRSSDINIFAFWVMSSIYDYHSDGE